MTRRDGKQDWPEKQRSSSARALRRTILLPAVLVQTGNAQGGRPASPCRCPADPPVPARAACGPTGNRAAAPALLRHARRNRGWCAGRSPLPPRRGHPCPLLPSPGYRRRCRGRRIHRRRTGYPTRTALAATPKWSATALSTCACTTSSGCAASITTQRSLCALASARKPSRRRRWNGRPMRS